MMKTPKQIASEVIAEVHEKHKWGFKYTSSCWEDENIHDSIVKGIEKALENYEYFKKYATDFSLEVTPGGYQWAVWDENHTMHQLFHHLDDAIAWRMDNDPEDPETKQRVQENNDDS